MDIALGVIGAGQTASAGKIAEMEAQTEAAQIETAAAQREADRKERLARAVSSQIAAGGASGLTFEGSPLSVLEEDVRREGEATQRDVLMSDLAAKSARARGTVAKKQAKGAAVLGLLKTASDAAKSFSPAPTKKAAPIEDKSTPLKKKS
jgi:hypothetical protein